MASPLSEAVILDIKNTLEELGQKGVRFIRPLIPSQTLQKSLTYDIEIKKTVFRLTFSVPQYWAIFVHDGRPAIASQGIMLYYRNPSDDPRLAGGRPTNKSDVRSLAEFPGEYEEGLEINKQMFEDFPGGGRQQFMVMTNFVGPVGPRPFFTVGLRGFGNTIRKAVRRKIQRRLKTSIDVKTRQITLRL